MSALFSSSFQYDPSQEEAFVTYVDPVRGLCSVKTLKNQILVDVRWLSPTGGSSAGGIHAAPKLGDRVLVSTALTYPIIYGVIPVIGEPEGMISATNSGGAMDVGTASSLRNGYVTNPNKPSDYSQGDIAMTSPGGGILSMLSSGGVVLKASALSQLVLTKFGNLARLVARNFQRFSDASSEVAVNVKGRLYHWFGQDIEFSRTSTGTHRYNEVVGDVALGEVYKSDGLSIDSTVTLPATDDRLKKIWLVQADGTPLMTETLYSDGKVELIIGESKVIVTPTDITLLHKTANVNINETAITSKMGEDSSVTITKDNIISKVGESASIDISKTDITTKFGDTVSLLVNAATIMGTVSSTSLAITDAGITTTSGLGKVTTTPTFSMISYGGNYVSVDASGWHHS